VRDRRRPVRHRPPTRRRRPGGAQRLRAGRQRPRRRRTSGRRAPSHAAAPACRGHGPGVRGRVGGPGRPVRQPAARRGPRSRRRPRRGRLRGVRRIGRGPSAARASDRRPTVCRRALSGGPAPTRRRADRPPPLRRITPADRLGGAERLLPGEDRPGRRGGHRGHRDRARPGGEPCRLGRAPGNRPLRDARLDRPAQQPGVRHAGGVVDAGTARSARRSRGSPVPPCGRRGVPGGCLGPRRARRGPGRFGHRPRDPAGAGAAGSATGPLFTRPDGSLAAGPLGSGGNGLPLRRRRRRDGGLVDPVQFHRDRERHPRRRDRDLAAQPGRRLLAAGRRPERSGTRQAPAPHAGADPVDERRRPADAARDPGRPPAAPVPHADGGSAAHRRARPRRRPDVSTLEHGLRGGGGHARSGRLLRIVRRRRGPDAGTGRERTRRPGAPGLGRTRPAARMGPGVGHRP